MMERKTGDVPTKNRWYRFNVIGPSVSILRGSCSMNDSHFKQRSRGRQSAPCSIVAIVYSRLSSPKNWTEKIIDEILEHGDKLFRTSTTKNRVNPESYLTANLVNPEFYIDDYKCKICVEKSKVYGNLFSSSIGCPNFSDGLRRFFKTEESAVVTAQGQSFAVWRSSDTEIFYYDPGPCEKDGSRSKIGTACAMRFKLIDDLENLFIRNMDRRYDSRYCIDRVKVVRVNFIDRGIVPNHREKLVVDKNILRTLNPMKVDDENLQNCERKVATKSVKNFTTTKNDAVEREAMKIIISNYKIDEKFATEPMIDFENFQTGYSYHDMEINVPSTFKDVTPKMSIIHGWTHETSEIYKSKGSQNVANCVVSIAMKKLHPVKTWMRTKLDEILVLGDQLYSIVKTEKPSMKTMTAADLNDKIVKIDGKKMLIDVDILTIVGTISSKIPEVLSLKRALEEFFLINENGIIECSSMALAVWIQDDYYYTFDPKQCDSQGVRIVEVKGKAKTSKKDQETMEKKIIGKCCAIRFTDIDEMVGLFVRNVDQGKKNDRFVIRNIVVWNDLPGQRKWKEFQPCEVGKTWILRGGISTDDDDFQRGDVQGHQGVAMPIVGLISAKDTPPAEWSKKTIDEAVKDGDSYYNWCTMSTDDEEPRRLTIEGAKKILYVKNRKIQIDIEESTIQGDLRPNDDGKSKNLVDGIVKFFENRQYGVIEVNDLAVAVWKVDEENNDKTRETFYYLYDANPRGRFGRKDIDNDDEEGGVACVIRATDPAELARSIENNVDISNAQDFSIHEVKIISTSDTMTDDELEREKSMGVKPEMNFYTEIGNDGACLNGSFDQTDETTFGPLTRDKQQAGNALVALGMRKLYNPHLWYREVVDDVLKLGDLVTQKNMGNLSDEVDEDEEATRDYLLPSEIDPEFDIGVNRVTFGLDEEVATCKVNEMTSSLEEFFSANAMGIVRQKNVMLAIWKEGDVYFTMDPRGRDNVGVPKDKDGAATVLWFTTMAALAESLRLSCGKSDDDVRIDAVTLETVYETRIAEDTRPKRTTSTDVLWHRFPKIDEGTWQLLGNVKMSDERFHENNRNKQTAAIAVMGIIFAKAYEPRQWSAEILDEVVVTGDKLHTQCIERLGRHFPPRVNEIVREFFLSNRRIDLEIEDCVEAGDLGGKPPKLQDLRTGLQRFFESSRNCGVLTINEDVNIGFWKFGDYYFAIVPGDVTDTIAENDTSGLPRVMRFADLTIFSNCLKNLFGNDGDYVITFVDVIDQDKSPPWKYDPSHAIRPSNLPPLNAYRKLPSHRDGACAILHAGTHQGGQLFPEKIRGKQTASNCIISLAMSVIKNPITWTKKTLDEILAIGTNLHRQTQKARPAKEKFTPKDIVRIFHVGVNVITCDVDNATITGPIAEPPPEPELKVKGKAKTKKPAKPKKSKKGKQKRIPPPPPPPIYLEQAMKMFFQNNRAGICVTGSSMRAIWRDKGLYFLYDPRSTNADGLRTDADGRSCAMWFACFEPLYDLVFANIDDDEKYGRYEIDRVIVRTTEIEALPCPASFRPVLRCQAPEIPVSSVKQRMATVDVEVANEYSAIDDDTAVLSGTLHMSHRCFEVMSRGLQSTAIAAVAIVVGSIHVPSTWTKNIVDAILKHGHVLHADSVRATRPGARTLSPDELIDVFVVGDLRANIQIHRNTAAGILHAYDLASSLIMFFRNNCNGILHTGNMAVAFMQHYGKFYMYDPCARDSTGRSSYAGSACVVESRDVVKLARLFVDNCNYKEPTVWTLNAVDVVDVHFFSDFRNEGVNNCDNNDE